MNPEFRRNLWLQLTPERLLVMPVVLALILTAVSTIGRDAVIALPWYAAAVLGLMWGARLSSASVLGEVAGRTWDWQRSSILTGWQMTWGKLFGATVYAWYGVGLALLAALAAAALLHPPPTQGLLDPEALIALARDWARLLLSCVLGQSVALLLALLLLARGSEVGRGNRLSAEVGGYLAGLGACLVAGGLARDDDWSRIGWFEWHPGGLALELATLAFWTAWAVIGAWRLMARELQIPLRPWAWPLFVFTAAIWAAGLAQRSDFVRTYLPKLAPEPSLIALLDWQLRCLVAVVVTVGATWLAALVDAKSPVRLRRWRAALLGRRIDQALALAPPWVLGLPVVLAAVAGELAVWAVLRPSTMEKLSQAPTSGIWQPSTMILSLLLFLVRDIALMYALAAFGGRRRVPAFVYLAILYGVLPAVAVALDGQALVPALVPILIPLPLTEGSFPPTILALVALQATAAIAFAWVKLRRALVAR